ncbi:MAG: hypothetical protein KBT88_13305 [Gammaproteobacteria bacterium]|nr:hypothetical protein [Gammaproteobacteria bacterium]MBQ0840755.1 hypothetical protein [Gammaproteobacteria bacterium]
MKTEALNEEENEILQEVINIGMGQAGASLAKLLDVFVNLSVPRVSWVNGDDFVTQVAKLVEGQGDSWAGVRQAFYNQLEGEAFAIYGANGCQQLAGLMGYEDENEDGAEEELLLDVTNILVGACLVGVANQISKKLDFAAPTVVGVGKPIHELLYSRDREWDQCLLIEVNFCLEEGDFSCHLVMLMSEASIEQLRSGLVQFMESY